MKSSIAIVYSVLFALFAVPCAFASRTAALASQVQAEAANDEASTRDKQANASEYLYNLDAAIGVLRSSLPSEKKKARLAEYSALARTWENVRKNKHADEMLATLAGYDFLVEGEHFWILEGELLTVRAAVGSFL
jgi:hypothetical protein